MNEIQLPCTQKEYEEIITWIQQKRKEEETDIKRPNDRGIPKANINIPPPPPKAMFENTRGKRVRITYVPYKYIDSLTDPYFYKITFGTIENMTCSNIYIINEDGCFEIFRLKQVLEMVQIEE